MCLHLDVLAFVGACNNRQNVLVVWKFDLIVWFSVLLVVFVRCLVVDPHLPLVLDLLRSVVLVLVLVVVLVVVVVLVLVLVGLRVHKPRVFLGCGSQLRGRESSLRH